MKLRIVFYLLLITATFLRSEPLLAEEHSKVQFDILTVVVTENNCLLASGYLMAFRADCMFSFGNYGLQQTISLYVL
jgi:hypothetical protein